MPTQNVMAVCNFDMQFIFACVRWEGTAHDTRVFISVLRNENLNFPKPPSGKNYGQLTFVFFITYLVQLCIHIKKNECCISQGNII